MSDECLMKQETVVSFYTQYQAVMRKFTLAEKFISNKPSSVKRKVNNNFKLLITSYKLVAHRAMLNYVIINLKFTVYEFISLWFLINEQFSSKALKELHDN